MRTIYKYELRITDQQEITIFRDAKLLHVASQAVEKHGPDGYGQWTQLCLWASVDPYARQVRRRIAIVGTGNPAPEIGPAHAQYIGTAHCPPFVWHVFDGGEIEE